MTTSQSAVRHTFFYVLLAGVGLLTFFILSPYIVTLAVAVAFSVVCQPLFLAIKHRVRGNSTIAAVFTVLIVILIVLGPISLMGMKVADEAFSLYESFNIELPAGDTFFTSIENTMETYVRAYVPNFDVDLATLGRQSTGWVTSHIGTFFSNILQISLHIFLGIVAFYYLLKDGPRFKQTLTNLSPLKDTHDQKILKRLEVAINSILKGSLFIALTQGVVSGIGFAIFGIPSATLWGAIAAVGALIPGIGTAIVIAPAVLYLFVSGATIQAVGLTIWGVAAVGTIDNFLGPILVGRGIRIHPLFIMFAAIGGIQFFGPAGFILGPLALSLLYALLDIYQIVISDKNSQTL